MRSRAAQSPDSRRHVSLRPAAADNAIVNGVEIEVRRHDLRVDPVLTAPTVAANLLRPLLLAWKGRLEGVKQLPERLIASGLLVGETDEVAAAYAEVGLVESERRESGEWAAVGMTRQRG